MKTTGMTLKTKNSLILIAVMIPLLAAFLTYEVIQERTSMRTALTERGVILAKTGAETMGKILEDAIDSGKLTEQQVFDTKYISIPNTSPQKYHTAYDAYTDANIRTIEDSFQKDKVVVFAVLVDLNGYLPTHNSNYSKVGAGLNYDRSKRIFDDEVGIKAARNTEQYLFQEYKRDTGETMWDISAPVYVKGRHWGAFRIGFSIEETNKQIAAAVNRVIFFGGILTIAIIILAVYISNRITSRVEILSEQANRVAGGDLSLGNLPFDSRDEVGKLGRSFANMVMKLRELAEKTQYSAKLIGTYTGDLLHSTEHVMNAASTVTSKMAMVSESMKKMEESTTRVAETSKSVSEELSIAENSSQKFLDNMEESKEAMSVAHNVVKDLEFQVEKVGQFIQVVSILAEQSGLMAQKIVAEADRYCSAGNEMAALATEVQSKAEEAAITTRDVSELFQTVRDYARKASDTLEGHRKVILEGINVARLSNKSLATIVSDLDILGGLTKEVLFYSKQLVEGAGSIDLDMKAQSDLVARFTEAAGTLEKVVAELQETINAVKM